MDEVEISEAGVPSLRRLLSLQSLIATTFSVVVGIINTAQFSFGLAKFGGLEYAPRVLILSVVRVMGPGVSTAAALYALVVWTHELDPSAIRLQLRRSAPWTIGLILLIDPLATIVAIASGNLISHWVYGVPWDLIRSSHRILTLHDVTAAGLALVESTVLTCVFCWFALPVMRRRSWSLLQKLGATWVAFVVLRGLTHLVEP